MNTSTVTLDRVWRVLNSITDPEIPVVSLVEMGIARDVALDGGTVVVTITPTFVGCPALYLIREEIVEKLKAIGVEKIDVRTVLNPPWTSEWLSAETRAKLKAFGLAPPPHHTGRIDLVLMDAVACPQCGSHDTLLENSFGPTLCRSIYYCRACRQSFERFKPL
jgi:ring-1,2-phenylacetyl-CoA epoxidase subunit PaaD